MWLATFKYLQDYKEVSKSQQYDVSGEKINPAFASLGYAE